MTPHHTGPHTGDRAEAWAGWTIIIPVKDTSLAKTRLTPFSQPDRAALALAFTLDAASAALQCPDVRRVIAVTNDTTAGRALRSIGVAVLADEPAAGLNPAVAFGAGHVRSHDPGSAVAAMCGDLPALRPDDLSRAFALANETDLWFIADAAGVGTTMLAAAPGRALVPGFGAGSRAQHRSLGALDLIEAQSEDVLARLRRDVDTLNDLDDARRLGVGLRTSDALVDIDAA